MIQKMIDYLKLLPSLSDSDLFLNASSYLINDVQAKELGLPENVCELWNHLILSTSCVNDIYKITDSSVINALLRELEAKLAVIPDSASTQYSINSNFSPYTDPIAGRSDLIEQIHIWLSTSAAPLFLYGIAGIGKSTLAKAYAAQYKDSYEQIIFATYETNLLDLITDDTKLAISGLVFRPRGKRGEKGRYFRQKLKLLRNLVTPRTLLIIDNFDVTRDERLKDILSLPCKIIFTTRTSPQIFGTQGIEIPALSDTETLRELFFLYAPEYFEQQDKWEIIDRLIASVHGHTLTVKLLASHLALENIAVGDLTFDSQDIIEQITHLFRLAHLTKDERTVLRYLSIMPLTGITLSRFSEYCQFTKMNIIHSLIGRNMIEYDSANEIISLHPLLAQIIRKTEQPDFNNCRPYALTMCEFGRKTWWNTSEEMAQYRNYFYSFMEYVDKPNAKLMDDIIYLVDGCWQLGNFALDIKC